MSVRQRKIRKPATGGTEALINSTLNMRTIFNAVIKYPAPILLLLATLSGNAAAADPTFTGNAPHDAKLYQQTLHAIRKGHKTNTRGGMAKLINHPLYPYLVKEELSKRLNQLPTAEVDVFLQQYDNTVVAKQLHKQWLKTLASKKQWAEFIDYYDPAIANTSLNCHYLEALHRSGHEAIALSQTSPLWMSGKSLPDNCDPVFKRWEQAGLNSDDFRWQRMQLALAEGNTQLARYLSKYASASLKPYTRRMMSVHSKPQRLIQVHDFDDHNPYTADIISYGLKRLARKDADTATELWIHYRGNQQLSPQQNSPIRDKIARQVIASGSEAALKWLITHDPNAEDSYLLEWRIRLALREQHWTQAGQWIRLLPEELRQHPRWRYWLARAQQQKDPEAANTLLTQLAGERNYYGFLAADLLQMHYGFNNDRLNPLALETLQNVPAIERSKAFYAMGELTGARREWNNAVQDFDQQQLADATQLAHQWGWHQQAIHTTIKANHWDDLAIRFPLAYKQDMAASAQKASIRLEWLYAITRQESAFAEDARSSADARGLMQLRPGTARQVAKSLGKPFSSRDLYRADTNIELGSNYLKQLLAAFDGNHILATAAYNAGPHNVNKWLKSQPKALPYDVWIETLPYHETRNYVQSVLAFSVIYSHRLGFNTSMMNARPLTVTSINPRS